MTTPKQITLANLAKSTAQEVFDWIVYNLKKQNEASYEGCACRYRTSTGLKCAAGWCIDDSEYESKFEGQRWSSLVDRRLVPGAHTPLINDCQRLIHDANLESGWSEESIRHIAKAYRLKINH